MKIEISTEELQQLTDLTVRLIQLRQDQCKHLSIEDIGPHVFHRLLSRYVALKNGIFTTNDFDGSDERIHSISIIRTIDR